MRAASVGSKTKMLKPRPKAVRQRPRPRPVRDQSCHKIQLHPLYKTKPITFATQPNSVLHVTFALIQYNFCHVCDMWVASIDKHKLFWQPAFEFFFNFLIRIVVGKLNIAVVFVVIDSSYAADAAATGQQQSRDVL